jgi:hypothetical protein
MTAFDAAEPLLRRKSVQCVGRKEEAQFDVFGSFIPEM